MRAKDPNEENENENQSVAGNQGDENEESDKINQMDRRHHFFWMIVPI